MVMIVLVLSCNYTRQDFCKESFAKWDSLYCQVAHIHVCDLVPVYKSSVFLQSAICILFNVYCILYSNYCDSIYHARVVFMRIFILVFEPEEALSFVC